MAMQEDQKFYNYIPLCQGYVSDSGEGRPI